MTAAYLVKTRTLSGVRRAARYPGESRPRRNWHTRAKATTFAAAQQAAAGLDRDDLFQTGPRKYEVGIFYKGRKQR